MTDPTPFPTDPLEAEGTDPDLSKDDDTRTASDSDDEERPDDRPPTHDEQMRDRMAAEEQDFSDMYTDID